MESKVTYSDEDKVAAFPPKIETISGLMKFLSESEDRTKDKTVADELLFPILQEASAFYHSYDDTQEVLPADPALAIALYVIGGELDEQTVRAIITAMGLLAGGFVFRSWAATPLSKDTCKRLAMITAAAVGLKHDDDGGGGGGRRAVAA
jgi:hypothetical protein